MSSVEDHYTSSDLSDRDPGDPPDQPPFRLIVKGDAGVDYWEGEEQEALEVMLAVINGHVEIVRALVQAGADTELRGSGAPGFHEPTSPEETPCGR